MWVTHSRMLCSLPRSCLVHPVNRFDSCKSGKFLRHSVQSTNSTNFFPSGYCVGHFGPYRATIKSCAGFEAISYFFIVERYAVNCGSSPKHVSKFVTLHETVPVTQSQAASCLSCQSVLQLRAQHAHTSVETVPPNTPHRLRDRHSE